MPYTKSFTSALPTIEQYKTAAKNADKQKASERDTREMQAMLAALPIADADVSGDMDTRRNEILGYPWAVEAEKPVGQPNPPDIEVQRAAEIQQRFRLSGLHRERGTLINGLFTGAVALDNLLWTVGTNAHIVDSYTVRDAVDLKFDASVKSGLSRYEYVGDTPQFTLQPYADPITVIPATYNPLRGIKSDYEGGLLRMIYYISLLKYWTIYDWSRVNKRWGDPPVSVTYPRNVAVKDEEVAKVYAWASELEAEGAAAYPDDIKIAMLELKALGVNVDSFEKFIGLCRSVQSRRILGNDVVNLAHSEGSYAASKEASKSEAKHNWHDILWIEDVISDSYVIADYRLNYGEPSTGLFPRFKIVTDQGEDYKGNAQIIETMIAAGYDVDPEVASRKVGIPVTKASGGLRGPGTGSGQGGVL